ACGADCGRRTRRATRVDVRRLRVSRAVARGADDRVARGARLQPSPSGSCARRLPGRGPEPGRYRRGRCDPVAVIVATEELPRLAGTVSMVDGGFDPLHAGHVAYFREAAALGDPVLCNLATDEWVARKPPPLLR